MVSALTALPAECTAVALVRHAEREPILDFRGSEHVPLTRQGEADAYRLGRHLPPGRLVRFTHSPVGRCRVTAVRIAEGLRAAGGRTEVLGSAEAFASPHVVDSDEVSREMRARGEQFVRAWFDGRVPPSAILHPRDAARRQWETIRGLAASAPPGSLTLVCTHDWNIMLVRETYLGVRHEDHGWADYLDGPVVALHDGECRLTWRDHAVAMPVSVTDRLP